MITIATFDIIENQDLFGMILEFPDEDEDDLDAGFAESGYDSAYMINLLGMGFIILVVIFFMMIMLLIFLPIKGCFKPVLKMHNKVSGIIFWGFWLRFIIEDCLVALISVFCDWKANDIHGEQNDEIEVNKLFLGIDKGLTIFLGIVLLALPIFILIFYRVNFNKL